MSTSRSSADDLNLDVASDSELDLTALAAPQRSAAASSFTHFLTGRSSKAASAPVPARSHASALASPSRPSHTLPPSSASSQSPSLPRSAPIAVSSPVPSVPDSSQKSRGRKRAFSPARDSAPSIPSSSVSGLDPAVLPVLRRVLDLCSSEVARQREQHRLTLADLNLPNVKTEVATLSESEVRKQIERIIVESAESILHGRGFSYSVPSRASGNQLYVQEIDRFVLKDRVSDRVFASLKNGRKSALTTRVLQLVYELCCKQIHVTKRDLFYTDVKLFSKQAESDDIIDDVACMIGCTRSSLNVVASEKGIVVGRIQFRDDGDLIDATKMGVGGKAIPPSIDRVSDITGDAKFVLLVEKDAAFMRLAEDRFYNTYPCVIITGKGQPDVATRLFVKKVKETLKIPVLALMDSDPYGLKILSVYMSGSKNMSYDSANLTTPDIKWLGVRPSDLDKYKIPNQCRLPMSEHDIKFGKEMLEEDFVKKNPAWYKELEMMVKRKEKAEIQALSNFGFQYLTQVYLPKKLKDGDWI